MGPWLTTSCKKRRPCFDNIPNVSYHFVCIAHTLITMFPPLVFSLFLPFSCVFCTLTPHTTHAPHTCTHNTMLQRHSMRIARHDTITISRTRPTSFKVARGLGIGQGPCTLAVRCRCVSLSVGVGVCVFCWWCSWCPSGQLELNIFTRERHLFRQSGTYSQTLNGQNPVVTLGEPLVQVIPPSGPFMANKTDDEG